MDQAFGILYDESGNDTYEAIRESQGTGLNFSGVGILLEKAGDDRYEARAAAQGNSILGPKTPPSRFPVGVLIDTGGQDLFSLSGIGETDMTERVQNNYGILIKR